MSKRSDKHHSEHRDSKVTGEFGLKLRVKDDKLAKQLRPLEQHRSQTDQPLHQRASKHCNSKVTYLRQTDFVTGSYRILNPGVYKLKENIVFNPLIDPNIRPDLPLSGRWFCAISIETDNVVLDGNGYKLEESTEYRATNLTGTFALVLLGNSPFSEPLFNIIPTVYGPPPGPPSYIPANNVVIKNIRLDVTSEFGIRGQLNNNITIINSKIAESQLFGVSLLGPRNLKIEDCKFRGSTKRVLITMEAFQLYIANGVLPTIPGGDVYLANLNAYAAENPARFNETFDHASTYYGISINAGNTALFPFPMNSASLVKAKEISGGRDAENITIKNCSFSNFTTNSHERIAIGTSDPKSPIYVPQPEIPLIFMGIFGILQWKDAYDSEGNFNPNPLSLALAYMSIFFYNNFIVPVDGPLHMFLQYFPASTAQVLNAILTNNVDEFNAYAAPIAGMGDDGTDIKGLFGIRMVGCKNAVLEDICMKDFVAEGLIGIDSTELPGYSDLNFSGPIGGSLPPLVRFRGNDVWFNSFEICENIKYRCSNLKKIESKSGYVFGVDLPSEDRNILIKNVKVRDLSAPETRTLPEVIPVPPGGVPITEPGEIHVFNVEHETGKVILKNVETCKFTAGGEIFPFPSPNENIKLINATICSCSK